jgi:hypothetical protein
MARRQYRFLSFQPGVDWQHVNPVLLYRMNRLGMALGKVITITSGARGVPGHPNTGAPGSHHVPGHNPSGKGEAVDAYVGSKPLGSVISNRMAAKYGLYSGNRPGFYKGKPDPEHFETLERRGVPYKGKTPPEKAMESAAAPAAATAPQDDAQVASTIPTIPDQGMSPGSPPQPEESLPAVFAPGSGSAAGWNPRRAAETWQLLASQPLSSPETQSLAQRAQLAAGG